MTLGFLDWGIGGFFALRRALQREPTLDVVYLSDTGQVPYGKQPEATLRVTVERGCQRLREHGATHVLVACHSASTVLPVGCIGVIRPDLVPAGRTLVLGGQRTVDSGQWDGPRTLQRVAQPLSAHIEAGRAQSADALADLDRILAGVVSPDTVVLACTHYSAMADAIQARFPKARLLDPALAVVDALALVPGEGRIEVLTTGRLQDLWQAAARAVPGPWLEQVQEGDAQELP
jgi:glutamate racemase